MNTFKQISEKEWISDDYRPAAEICREADKLFPHLEVNFHYYFEDGLGEAKGAYFLTSKGRRFFIVELLNHPEPITTLGLLNNPATWDEDLNNVLDLLNLSRADLIYIHNWQIK